MLALALLVTSCGGDEGGGEADAGGGGDDAVMTVGELCDSLDDVVGAFDGGDWPALQRGWVELGERRLPEEMPALAQEGVQVYAEFAARSDSMETYRAEVDQPSPDEAKAMVAVEDYYGATCG